MAFEFASFLHENGLLLTADVIVAGLWRRAHNRALSAALPGRPAVNIHPSAHIRGVRHIAIAGNFRAGRHLWLEAVLRDNDRVFAPRLTIGRNVIVNDDVHIAATNRVEIGNDVLLASRIYIADHGHGDYRTPGGADPDLAPRFRPVGDDAAVVIGDCVWIGDLVAVLPGVTIGRGSVIGAGSVVTSSIPPSSIAVGAPARVIKTYDSALRTWVSV